MYVVVLRVLLSQCIYYRKKITDISVEENNFLVVAHGLTKIVFPLIKKEYETNCHEICMAILKQQGNDSFNHDTKGQKKKVYLMQKQQELSATKGIIFKRTMQVNICFHASMS